MSNHPMMTATASIESDGDNTPQNISAKDADLIARRVADMITASHPHACRFSSDEHEALRCIIELYREYSPDIREIARLGKSAVGMTHKTVAIVYTTVVVGVLGFIGGAIVLGLKMLFGGHHPQT